MPFASPLVSRASLAHLSISAALAVLTLGSVTLGGCGLVLDASRHDDAGASAPDTGVLGLDAGPNTSADAALDAPPDLTPDAALADRDAGPPPDAFVPPGTDAFVVPDAFVPFDACVDLDLDGFSTCEGDCDDGHDTVYPGAPYVCGDGLVNDCTAGPGPDDAICLTGGLYVSAIVGDDTTGTGAPDRPFGTINHAVTVAETMLPAPQDVIIGQGDYREDVRVVEGISLWGGHEEGTWIGDPSSFHTILYPTSGEGLAIPGSVTGATTLDGLEIEVPHTRTLGTAGVGIGMGASPLVSRCAVRVSATSSTVVGIEVAANAAPTLRGIVVSVAGATGTALGTGLFGVRGTMAKLDVDGLDVRLGAAGALNVFGVDLGASTMGSALRGVHVRAEDPAALRNVTGIRVNGGGVTIERAVVLLGPLQATGSGTGVVLGGLTMASSVVNSVLYAGQGGARQVALLIRYEGALPAPLPPILVHSNVLDGGTTRAMTMYASALELSIGGTGPAVTLGTIRSNILRCDSGVTSLLRATRALPAAFDTNALSLGPSSLGTYYGSGLPSYTASNFEDEDCDVPIAFGDYHLPDGSFCIDRGAASLGPPDDFEGDLRGALPDIGADEHVP